MICVVLMIEFLQMNADKLTYLTFMCVKLSLEHSATCTYLNIFELHVMCMRVKLGQSA